jgi:ABC-type nitrate/sulfonate/bicarbonate transport system permease component
MIRMTVRTYRRLVWSLLTLGTMLLIWSLAAQYHPDAPFLPSFPAKADDCSWFYFFLAGYAILFSRREAVSHRANHSDLRRIGDGIAQDG